MLVSFHEFAVRKVQAEGNGLSFEELLDQWRKVREREEANAAICQGLVDIENGNYRLLDDFMTEFRVKHSVHQPPAAELVRGPAGERVVRERFESKRLSAANPVARSLK